MDLYFVMGPAGPALCKYRYLLERGLEDQPHLYRSFLGSLAHVHAARYVEWLFPTLWPSAEVQINELVVGPFDHRLLTSRSEPADTRQGRGVLMSAASTNLYICFSDAGLVLARADVLAERDLLAHVNAAAYLGPMPVSQAIAYLERTYPGCVPWLRGDVSSHIASAEIFWVLRRIRQSQP